MRFVTKKIREKELILCQEEMEQGRAAGDAVPAEVWVEAPDRAEAEWAAHLLRGRAETVYALAAANRSLILPDSLVIKGPALNVVRK